jgi:hypothetical protein
VVLVEVEIVRLEPPEAGLECAPDLLGRALAAPDLAAATELGREYDPLAAATERAPEERLAQPVAVAIGGVEEDDAGVKCGVDHGARRGLVDTAAEVVAAEPNEGDFERPERPRPHRRERIAPRPLLGAFSIGDVRAWQWTLTRCVAVPAKHDGRAAT